MAHLASSSSSSVSVFVRSLTLTLLVLLLVTITCTSGETGGAAEAEPDHDHEHETVQGVDPERVSQLATKNTEFATKIYNYVRGKTRGSIFFSPFSISSMLAMLHLGTDGDTKDQLDDVLDLEEVEDVHDVFRQTLELLLTHNDHFTLLIANRLFARNDFVFKEEYNNEAGQYYKAGLEEIDFAGDPEGARDAINTWVEEQTQNMIQDLLPPNTVNSLTHLVMVNAIYFQSEWENPFNERKTHEADFQMIAPRETVKVDMMKQSGQFNYAEVPDFNCKMIELPYRGNHLSMFIFLPDDISYSRTMEYKIGKQGVTQLFNTPMELTHLDLYLPRIQLSVEMNLKSFLQKQGVLDLFEEGSANLTMMTDDQTLYVTELFHKSYLNVYENGTEAASATAAVIVGQSIDIPAPVEFRADHPFAFVIRENPTETILFVGRYMGPNQQKKGFGTFGSDLPTEPVAGESKSASATTYKYSNLVAAIVSGLLCVVTLHLH